ncbi:hypothetical protein J004_05705, partial [Cryptococcus neoformans]
ESRGKVISKERCTILASTHKGLRRGEPLRKGYRVTR